MNQLDSRPSKVLYMPRVITDIPSIDLSIKNLFNRFLHSIVSNRINNGDSYSLNELHKILYGKPLKGKKNKAYFSKRIKQLDEEKEISATRKVRLVAKSEKPEYETLPNKSVVTRNRYTVDQEIVDIYKRNIPNGKDWKAPKNYKGFIKVELDRNNILKTATPRQRKKAIAALYYLKRFEQFGTHKVKNYLYFDGVLRDAAGTANPNGQIRKSRVKNQMAGIFEMLKKEHIIDAYELNDDLSITITFLPNSQMAPPKRLDG